MKKFRSDPRFRSLLHKSVRRGNVELVITASALLETFGPKEKGWVKERAAAITFEECWPLGTELVFNKRYHSKVAAMVKVARSAKVKDAAGLGSLGSALAKGDRSVITGSADDKHIRIIARAIERPQNFWDWVKAHAKSDDHKDFIENAARFKNARFPWDRALILAGAYLSTLEDFPDTRQITTPDMPFPYWIALDHQTPQGRRVLRDIARDLHIQLPQLIWTCFFFEGSRTNSSLPSHWWEIACDWRFRKVGMMAAEAHLLWEPAKVQVIEALVEDSRQLHNDLYAWKLSNLERVESLKKQVELYIQHFDGRPGDQLDLF